MTELPYCGSAPLPGELLARFNFDPFLIASLAAAAALQLWNARRLGGGRYLAAAWGGRLLRRHCLSPLCALSVALFSARIAQHMILVLIAAPLIAAGMSSRPVRSAWPLWVSTVVFFVSLWFWHMLLLYDATFHSVRRLLVHACNPVRQCYLVLACIDASRTRPCCRCVRGGDPQLPFRWGLLRRLPARSPIMLCFCWQPIDDVGVAPDAAGGPATGRRSDVGAGYHHLSVGCRALAGAPMGCSRRSARRVKPSPLGYLDAAGVRAQHIVPLTLFTLCVSIVVCVVIASLFWIAVRRKRIPHGVDIASVSIERGADGIRWIRVGLLVSALPLAATLVWTLQVLAAIGAARQSGLGAQYHRAAVVVGCALQRRAAWQYRIRDGWNEIHIPVGKPVLVRLHAADVIHSFWVPKLAGKTDVIPGQTNQSWMRTDEPGRYLGQCSEFLRVISMHTLAAIRSGRSEIARGNSPAWETAQRGSRRRRRRQPRAATRFRGGAVALCAVSCGFGAPAPLAVARRI